MATIGSKRPSDDPSAFTTGQAIGSALGSVKRGLDRAEQVGQGVAAATADTLTSPMRRSLNAVANVGRGIGASTGLAPDAQPQAYNPSPMQDRVAAQRPEVYGLSRPIAGTAPAPVASVARPDFNSVVGSANTMPDLSSARGAAGPTPVSVPAGGAPASPELRTPQLGDLNTFTGFDGRTQAITPANPGIPAGGGVPAQSFGGAPGVAPIARPTATTQSTQTLGVPGIRLPSMDTSRVRQADAQRDALAKRIGDVLFRNGIGGLRSRGQRQFAAQLLGTQAELTGQAGSTASAAAGQALGAATQVGTTTLGQVGANQRALLGEQAATGRTLIGEEGANARADQQEAGLTHRALNRPEYITGSDGNLLQVTGGQGTPVLDPQGNLVRKQHANAQLKPAEILDAYSDALAASIESQPIGTQVDPARLQAELDASPLGQARNAVLAGLAPGGAPAAAIDYLRQHPNQAAAFDAKYGAGAAARALNAEQP